MKLNKAIELVEKRHRLLINRDNINKELLKIREDLKKTISPLYWDLENNLFDLEKKLGIPFNQIHLFVLECDFIKKCKLCFNDFTVRAKTRSKLEAYDFCSDECSRMYHKRNHDSDDCDCYWCLEELRNMDI